MPARISRSAYASMYGPTTGDKVRLADTDLIIEVERDLTTYGEEVKFGGGKVITDGLVGGAIDTLDLTVMPEAIGTGIPLFANGFAAPMKVHETTAYGNGALRIVYDLRP